jgi:hypothetical protein
MKILFSAALLITSLLTSCGSYHKDDAPMDKVVNDALTFCEKQSLLMASKYASSDSLLPRSYVDGQCTSQNSRWWCSGFFPGVLWYLYENDRDDNILNYARHYTDMLEREQYTKDNHDIGFILFCSFGNGYRLTNNPHDKDVLLTGARSLSSRFNPRVGLIRSWDFNKNQWQYPVIIDNMMNLEMLLWASKASGNPYFKKIAESHADKTSKYHYRPDESCFHVVSYDTITGLPHIRQTNQGYSDQSAWSRGQTWGLYGFTFMYRYTHEHRYLDKAESIAHYLIHQPNMPKDYIPYWDFDAPNIPNAKRDASAAAIMASALIELSQYVDHALSREYLKVAETQLRVLSSDKYRAKTGRKRRIHLEA